MDKKEELGNCKPCSLTSAPKKVVDKILLQVFPNTKDKKEAEEQYALIYEGEIVLKKPW